MAIMMRPELSNGQTMWEVRLLNALRMMTVLRARSGGSAAKEESQVVCDIYVECQCRWSMGYSL